MTLIRATILKGGVRCMDAFGNIYTINGLMIVRKVDNTKVFYDKNDKMCKTVCAEKTTHPAMVLDNGKVNIY